MAYCSDQNTYYLTQEIYIREVPLGWLAKISGAPSLLIRIINLYLLGTEQCSPLTREIDFLGYFDIT